MGDQDIPSSGQCTIVILAAGTRGDVQPLFALAARLQQVGHTVRVATHPAYQQACLKAGVPHFYPLGGDPDVLTQVAVRSNGILPHTMADLMRVRSQYADIIRTVLPAATEPLAPGGPPLEPDCIISTPITYGAADVAEALGVPFILTSAVPWATSKDFCHPWARAYDQSFSQLAVSITSTFLPDVSSRGSLAGKGKDPSLGQSLRGMYSRWRQRLLNLVATSTNLGSTPFLNFMVWSGIFDLLAVLRLRHLHLPPFPSPFKRTPLRLFTFSPSLLPPPADWSSSIAVVGPLLLHQALSRPVLQQSPPHPLPPADAEVIVQPAAYTKGRGVGEPAPINLPQAMEIAGHHTSSLPPSLVAFLESGPPPVVIAMGSAAVAFPETLVCTVLSAVAHTGVRAVVCRGVWEAWPSSSDQVLALLSDHKRDLCTACAGVVMSPEELSGRVHVVEEVDHFALMPHCSAAVVAGGVGTVTAALAAGLPTLVVPAYGDQHFWGQVVAERGAGPSPVPLKDLTPEALTQALHALTEQAGYSHAAAVVSKQMAGERPGLEVAVDLISRELTRAAKAKRQQLQH